MAFKKENAKQKIDAKSFELKYRSDSFDTYCGNDKIKNDLDMQLAAGTVSHFMIFYGSTGTGKTTMGRLLGRELVCPNKLPNGHACGVCPVCKEVTEQYIKLGANSVGRGAIREPNISKDTGKDFILNLIDEVTPRPLPPYKIRVVLLDEAHKASPAAQNAMLKSLEEAPEHLYYILCTTELDKILDTVKGRATIYHVKKPTLKQLTDRLVWICQQENLKYDVKALELLVRKKNRVPRNAIKALDEMKNYGTITQQVVSDHLEIIGNEEYIRFFKLLKRDIVEIYQEIDDLLDRDIEVKDFIEGLIRFVLDAINMKHGIKLDSYTDKMYTEIRKLFKTYDYDSLVLMLKDLNKFASRNFSSDTLQESELKELAIKLSRPFFFERTLTKAPQVIEAEAVLSDTNYGNIQQERVDSVSVQDDEITDVNAIASYFDGSFVVENEHVLVSKSEEHIPSVEYLTSLLHYADDDDDDADDDDDEVSE